MTDSKPAQRQDSTTLAFGTLNNGPFETDGHPGGRGVPHLPLVHERPSEKCPCATTHLTQHVFYNELLESRSFDLHMTRGHCKLPLTGG